MTRRPWGTDANRFPAPARECVWRNCNEPQFADMPVCFDHAIIISSRLKDMLALDLELQMRDDDPAALIPSAYVYYLMVGPSTVKIGTTANLRSRIAGLRSDLQYVVALEVGDLKLERQRHKEFAAERIGRREDFRLSDRLKKHIEQIQPNREQLLRTAIERSEVTPPCHAPT